MTTEQQLQHLLRAALAEKRTARGDAHLAKARDWYRQLRARGYRA